MNPMIGVFLIAAWILLAVEIVAISRLYGWCSHLGLAAFRLSGSVLQTEDIGDSLRKAGLMSAPNAPGGWLVRSMSWVEQGGRVPQNIFWGVGVLQVSNGSWQLEGRCTVGLPLFLSGVLLGLIWPLPASSISIAAWLFAWAVVAACFFEVQTKDARRVFERFQEITTRTATQ